MRTLLYNIAAHGTKPTLCAAPILGVATTLGVGAGCSSSAMTCRSDKNPSPNPPESISSLSLPLNLTTDQFFSVWNVCKTVLLKITTRST
ncbi:hypothetical protein CASFOL_005446 [Castilleja foliolosa]|uniref:Secreted protein n=1 Tax=Castilleja foliolosa TaxID=1961234 RepID=A0ABD3E3F8_9LAMI